MLYPQLFAGKGQRDPMSRLLHLGSTFSRSGPLVLLLVRDVLGNDLKPGVIHANASPVTNRNV